MPLRQKGISILAISSIGREQYKMGTLDMGIVKKRYGSVLPPYARYEERGVPDLLGHFFCSGGCHANADLVNGTIEKPYEYGCKIQRKRLEMAIIVRPSLPKMCGKAKRDERPVIDNLSLILAQDERWRRA